MGGNRKFGNGKVKTVKYDFQNNRVQRLGESETNPITGEKEQPILSDERYTGKNQSVREMFKSR